MIESVAGKQPASRVRHATGSRFCAVLGHPIEHSLSPVLHQAAYTALGLADWVYERLDVTQDELPHFLASRDHAWVGLSLTMPLKRTIMDYGAPANTWAAQLGIANTALFTWDARSREHGELHNPVTADSSLSPRMELYNTDVEGVIGAIDGHRPPHVADSEQTGQRTAVILGNGSTALSAVAACTTFKDIDTLVIAARRPNAGEHIRAFLAHQAPSLAVRYVALDEAIDILPTAHIAVSTLPAHAADGIANKLRQSVSTITGTLLDVAYDPRPSLLNQVWQRAGGVSITGDEMLLYQAIPQVEIMTRRWCQRFDRATVEQAMRQALREALA